MGRSRVMSIGEGWAQGARQGEKIGEAIFIGFRILWFFIRVTWWLGQFLIFSLVAGAVSLVRPGSDRGLRSVLSGSHPLAGCAQRAVVSRGERAARSQPPRNGAKTQKRHRNAEHCRSTVGRGRALFPPQARRPDYEASSLPDAYTIAHS